MKAFQNISFITVLLLILITMNLSVSLYAQKYNIKFENTSILQGLSQNTVTWILQDSKGFMWFGTEDGLNKYDGYSFTIYKNDLLDSSSISDNYILTICEDSEGGLWIGTEGGGLNKFNRENEQFTRYKHDPNNSNSLSHNHVNSIFEDRAGVLWIGTEGGGLNKFNRENEQFTRYKHDPNNSNSLSHNRVNSIFEDRAGVLWIGTEVGLNKFDREKEKFTHYKHNPDNSNSISNNYIRSIYEDRSGGLWIGTYGGGLNRLDREKGGFVYWAHEPGNPNSLSNNFVNSIYEDRTGVIWIGTFGGGFSRFDPEIEKFTHYTHDPNNSNSLSTNIVFSIYEDRSGMLWIGTYGGGLNRFNKEKGKFAHWIHEPENPNSLCSNSVRSIYEDKTGMLWIGTYDGLNKFDREKGKFTHYKHNPDDSNSLSHNYIRSIYEDRSGVLWIGTFGGLNKFDREREQFTNYKPDPDNPNSLSDNRVVSIYEDRTSELWIGTGGGLNKFNREKEQFTHYKHEPNNPNSLSNNRVLSIYEDRTGVLWLGTYGGGLNRFDREKEKFIHFREKDGLPNDVIYGILEDNKGNLWISTNKGVSKFNPQTETFRNYDVNDGLQSNEFNSGSYHKSKSGEMFFGGVNGFNAFYPELIRDNPHIPLITITDFHLFNKPVPIGKGVEGHSILKKSITETKEIRLSYKDRVLSFEFAALHYTSPDKNEYAYIMEGFEEDWNFVGNRHFATYTNLSPGDYIFRVKGSNNDGVWNNEGVSLKITVTPPFWQTWWFRVFSIIAILLLIISAHQYRTHNIRERSKQLKERVEERTLDLKAANKELQKEITERKRAEEALQTEKTYLDQLFATAQEAIVMTDNDGQILRVNSEFTRLFGYTHDEAVGQSIDDLVASKDLFDEAVSYTKQLAQGKRIDFESVRRRKDGTLINVLTIGAPIIIGKEQVAVYGIYRDITERKKAEEDVKRRATQAALIYKVGQRVSSELEIKALLSEIVSAVRDTFDYYGVMMLLLDEEAKCLTLQSIAGGYVNIMPEDLCVAIGEGMIGQAAATGETQVSGDVSRDPHYVRKANEKTKSELSVPIKSGDKVIGVLDIQSDEFNAFNEADMTAKETLSTQIAIAIENARLYQQAQREITERKQAEKQIKASLKEKEVLLKEIHHRVKNNLQIISSLLKLQSNYIRGKKALQMFKDSQDRIKSMALIHEKLYQSEDLSSVNLKSYIKDLVHRLIRSYEADPGKIALKMDIEDVSLAIDTAIPCGLIINELISNCLKHAFPQDRKGEIKVELHSRNKNEIELVVGDTGVGLPDDFDFRKTKSLGFHLITILAEDQLKGKIELNRTRGTEFKIKFAREKIS